MTVFQYVLLILIPLGIVAVLAGFLQRLSLVRIQKNAQKLLEQLLCQMQTSDYEQTRAQLHQLVNTVLPDRLIRLGESSRKMAEWSLATMPEVDTHDHHPLPSNIWKHADVAEMYDRDAGEQIKLRRDVGTLMEFLEELNRHIYQHGDQPLSPEIVRARVEHIFIEFTAT